VRAIIADTYPKIHAAASGMGARLTGGPVSNSVWVLVDGFPLVALLLSPPGQEIILDHKPGPLVIPEQADKLVKALRQDLEM